MKKLVNGVIMEMTPEEIQQLEEQKEYEEQMKNQSPTQEDRLRALESAMLSMMGGM